MALVEHIINEERRAKHIVQAFLLLLLSVGVDAVDLDDRRALGEIGGDDDLIEQTSISGPLQHIFKVRSRTGTVMSSRIS